MSTRCARFLFAFLLPCLAPARVAGAQVFDAVTDFTITANPSGQWTYGDGGNINGTAFVPYAHNDNNVAPNIVGWTKAVPFPDNSAVLKNTSSSTVTYFGTIIQPPDLLNLDPLAQFPMVRFVAPLNGVYSISGRFERIDAVSSATDVRIIENGSATLLAVDQLAGYGSAYPFSLSNIVLHPGDTIDFIAGGGGTDLEFLSTGLAATIRVPEPATASLLFLGALIGLRRTSAPANQTTRRKSLRAAQNTTA